MDGMQNPAAGAGFNRVKEGWKGGSAEYQGTASPVRAAPAVTAPVRQLT